MLTSRFVASDGRKSTEQRGLESGWRAKRRYRTASLVIGLGRGRVRAQWPTGLVKMEIVGAIGPTCMYYFVLLDMTDYRMSVAVSGQGLAWCLNDDTCQHCRLAGGGTTSIKSTETEADEKN